MPSRSRPNDCQAQLAPAPNTTPIKNLNIALPPQEMPDSEHIPCHRPAFPRRGAADSAPRRRPRRIASFSSGVPVLGVPDADGNVVLVQPSAEVPLGGRLY
jgi:hypothetical protein